MTCAVVATAAYMSGKGYGAEIDAHDVVVRINTGFKYCEENAADLGTRTDIVYANKYMFRHRARFGIPPGVQIVKKHHVIPDTLIPNVYEANTGILAVCTYATQRYGVTVYGMDFYSGAFGGVIPEHFAPGGKPDKVARHSVYLKGYNEDLYGSQTHVMGHVGGMRDFAVFVAMQRKYGIKTDPDMAKVIAGNLHRLRQ